MKKHKKQFFHGESKELMNILSLTLWKQEIRDERKKCSCNNNNSNHNGAKSTQSCNMCTHAMTVHRTECDFNIYELKCELIEQALSENELNYEIKMRCDNATNHHMKCSVCVCPCVRACCCFIHKIYLFICVCFNATSNWMLNHTHYTIYNERADFSSN